MTDLGIDFLRPWWLLGLVPWMLAAIYMVGRHKQSNSGWEQVVDPILQPYVIEPGEGKAPAYKWLLLLGWLVCLLTLSGPVWEKQEIPVFQGQQAQVVLFDLSRSMLSDDVKPSRVTRARFKLTDFLENAVGVQIALIAFAERPYVVSPLSDDANTIASFVESLDPAIMPAQGSRVDLAIEKGVALFSQAGIRQGQLVLITDSDVGAKDISAAAAAKNAGHRLSIIGVGTEQGAPLRSEDGRFLQDASGAVVVPQLKPDALGALASAGGGVYMALSNGDQDLQTLARVQQALAIDIDDTEKETSNEYWVEYSPYIVLFLCVWALMLFRRGVIW